MAKVIELIPGDKVTNPHGSAIFVAQTTHPIYPSFQLVIWYMGDNQWSFDALMPGQEVGKVNYHKQDRQRNLRTALQSDGLDRGYATTWIPKES